ncbi:ERG2/sigma1 receptor-like protein [Mycena crocata]|nr:ERG2/sigma1 receptor-like protein [Mycena crocata]
MPATKKSQSSVPSPFLPKWAFRSLILLGLVVIGGLFDRIKHRWYVFDPVQFNELARAAIAASPDDTPRMIQHIITNLTNTYPSTVVRINLDSDEWVFNNAGGAMSALYIIHASITEYLFIFGTPLGTDGTPKQYKIETGCFALEYARAWIPLIVPFGLADGLTSTLDFVTLYRTAKITLREMVGNLLVGKI